MPLVPPVTSARFPLRSKSSACVVNWLSTTCRLSRWPCGMMRRRGGGAGSGGGWAPRHARSGGLPAPHNRSRNYFEPRSWGLDVPVIAAGGLMTAVDVADVMACGAVAARWTACRLLLQYEDRNLARRSWSGTRRTAGRPRPPASTSVTLGAVDFAGGQFATLSPSCAVTCGVGLDVVVPATGASGRRPWTRPWRTCRSPRRASAARSASCRTSHRGGEQDDWTVENLDAVGGALLQDAFGLLAYPVGGAQFGVFAHAARNVEVWGGIPLTDSFSRAPWSTWA